MIRIISFLFASLMILPINGQILSSSNANLKIPTIEWSKSYEVAKSKKRKRKKKRYSRSKKKSRYRRSSQGLLQKSLSLAKTGNYVDASKLLFKLSRSPRYRREKIRLRYLLGLMFYEMNLKQAAAFQFVEVIKSGESRYLKQSLEKLSLAADYLGDSTILNYAISKVKVSEFPRVHRDMLNFRIGEYKENAKASVEAAKYFSRVKEGSPFYFRAKYHQGLAYAERGHLKRAIRLFDQVADMRSGKGITDHIRVLAMLSKARLYYQQKKWTKAIEAYREIPRDTYEWHEALFESSWAMLRSARFRSALSNFHTIHSAYYDEVYQPESLLLRAIVYLYICKYDEMEKVLLQFEKTYKPVKKSIRDFLNSHRMSSSYIGELEKVYKLRKHQGFKKGALPYILGRKILQESDVQKSLEYLGRLEQERAKVRSMNSNWRRSAVGSYTKKILAVRIKNTRNLLGKKVRNHLIRYRTELRDFEEQAGFIRYEMINGRKDALRKKIAGKGVLDTSIEQDNKRDFYVQNGYEFWPFQGEYWLDEIGNYHYIGTQNCE